MTVTRSLLALAAALALSAPVAAQPVGAPQSITVVDSGTRCVTAPTACATFALDNSTGGLTISVSGTWTGTLTFEGTNNDGTWTSLMATNLATLAQATTTTANGLFTVPNPGLIKVTARATAAITGTATITAAKGLGFARSNFFTAPVTLSAAGLASTSTDGLVVSSPTAATVGATVQMSPRLKWCGAAWNSVGVASEADCFYAEVLPVTAAGTTTAQFNLFSSINGGAGANVLQILSGGQATFAGNIIVPSTAGLVVSGRAALIASASKLVQLEDSGGTTGIEFNGGSATLGTCTGGTITTGSHNFAGGYTGNTSSSCVVNFGTPSWTNAPFCMAASIASTTHPRISAVSTSSMTVTGGVSGEAITYHCSGRIGT